MLRWGKKTLLVMGLGLGLALVAPACNGFVTDLPGGGGGGGADDTPPPVLPRLTATQYRNTLVELFGDAVPAPVLPADTNPYLFYSVGAASTELSELGAQQYTDAAAVIADWVVANAATMTTGLFACTPTTVDDPCVATLLGELGLRLFRRPLTAAEVASWGAVVADAGRGDASRGLRMAIYGMLQSPYFLYRVELGEPDPAVPTRLRYTSYEMAGRLSFLLWDAGPDRELLDAAARGELLTPEGLQAHATRLLESPRARGAVQQFFAQYLDLASLDALERDPGLFPTFTPTLPPAMKREVQLLVEDLVFADGDVRGIFSTRRTFVNRELAALYGVDAPGATDVDFVPVELPVDGPRAGVLTSAAFLTMNAHVTETSPTLRGKYLRERVLCQGVPAPGDNVDLVIDPPDGVANTLRERLERHVTDPSCASCHTFIDPPGYLFEGFDAIGAFRTTDAGYPVDTSGDLDGTPLANARELADVLATDPRVPACLVKQLYRHASGRLETREEAPVLEGLTAELAASGYRMKDLLVALALSDGFRTVGKEVTP